MSRVDDLLVEHCPTGVPFRPLGQLASRNKGINITAGQMRDKHVPGAPVRVFAAGNTKADLPASDVPAGYVITAPSIIVKSRGHIGFEYYEGPFTHKNELWSYTANHDVSGKFIYYYLLTQAEDLQNLARATSVKLPQLSVGDTDRLLVPAPPIEVQNEIVRILDTFSELEAELEAELKAELEARRKQYAHYRDALCAALPEDTQRPLRDCGEFLRGRRFTKADYVESGVPSLHYGEIYTHFCTSAAAARSFVREDLAPSLRMARPGDLIIAATSENVDDVGKAVAWLGNTEVAVHDDSYIFRHGLEPKFVAYFFQTTQFHEQKKRSLSASKVVRISADRLSAIEMPVPPRDEQKRIVAALDSFEALVNDLSVGLPAELAARRKQYEYYRDKLLTFEEAT